MINEESQFEPEPDAEAHALKAEHSDTRGRLALQMMRQVRDSITHVIELLENGDTARATRQMVDLVSHKQAISAELEDLTGARVLEGVFDGQFMVGADGVRYPVAENYASKSKMVEGDVLKLTVKPDGTHVYKQIGPVARKRLVGRLGTDSSTKEPVVISGDDVYKVLAASVSYYKGVPGDEVIVLVPESDRCVWAAVENIVSG
jgi:hypothetical protein